MTDRDIMQQALEALEEYSPIPADGPWNKRHHKAITALNNRLAQPEPVSHAGIKIWIGDKQVVQHLTQTQLHHARDPWMLFVMTAFKCIAALKENT